MAAPTTSVPTSNAPGLTQAEFLSWLYVGRMSLSSAILVAVLVTWFDSWPAVTLTAIGTVVFLMLSLAGTAWSFWFTHLARHEPTQNFLYTQIIFDAVLVTGIVHLTGGPDSEFASAYVLVISAGALLLPLFGGLLIGGLTSMLYAADLVWGWQEPLSIFFALRLLLFAVVAVVTALIGDRLRLARAALGAALELRQLRLDTDDILANLSTGVVTVDGDGRLAYANRSAEGLLGTGLQPLLGLPVLDELDRLAPSLGSMLQQAIHGGEPIARGLAEAESRGGFVLLGVSTALLERGTDQMPSATALIQDITDLERLDEMKVRTQRFEAVATLSASLAHEIKNPLASIRSAVEQLSRGRLAQEDREVLERLVLSESDRLSRLLSEFLDYSGLGMSAHETLDIHAVVCECLLLVKQHPDLKGVEITAILDDGPVPLVGDADLLHRALFNLVLNGAQAAGAGGWVKVTLDHDASRTFPRGTAIEHPVRLSVSDSGPGIAESERARIFDPFFTTKRGGSGLGLAVVHRAVDAHGGATFVDESTEGGAAFVVFLPAHPVGAGVEATGVPS